MKLKFYLATFGFSHTLNASLVLVIASKLVIMSAEFNINELDVLN